MPNWGKNKLSIFSESDEQMEEFLEFIRDGDNVFSLNKILPMPEALRQVQSPTKVATQEEINVYKEQYKDKPYMMDSLPITQETCDALMNMYGVSNWYDWANEHWGTKWDTSGSKITESYPSEVNIDFDNHRYPDLIDPKLDENGYQNGCPCDYCMPNIDGAKE